MCVTAPRSFPFNETSCVIKHHLKTKSNPSSNTTKPGDSISMSKQSDKKALKEKHDKKIVGKNYYKEVLGLDPKSEKKALISVGVSYFIYFNQVAFESIIRFKM